MNTLIIKKEELTYNIKQIRELLDKAGKDDNGNPIKIIAVLKENSNILGLIEYAKFLIKNGISFFAVETIEEGIALREGGIKEEILMLCPTAIKEDIEILVKNNIIITLGSKEDIITAEIVAKEQKKKIKAHLNIDTGIGIQGFNYNKRDELIEILKSIKNIQIEGTFSKFVNSSSNDKYTKIQFQRFIDVIEVLQMNKIPVGMFHICDDSACLRFTNMNLNGIRIENAFFGEILNNTNAINLRNVAFLETKICEIKEVPKGFYIGNYKAKKEMRIAVIPYKCSYEKKNQYIMINKNKCKIIENIENNLICDIGQADIKIGEKITFPVNISNVCSYVRREYR